MRILQIKETCIYTEELSKIKSFYADKLAFPIISEVHDQHIFFRAGTSVLLCFNPKHSKFKSSPPAHFGHGPLHLAFEVPASEYLEWKEKIINLEIEVIDEVTWGNGLKSFYFNDPVGNVLEIVPVGVWD